VALRLLPRAEKARGELLYIASIVNRSIAERTAHRENSMRKWSHIAIRKGARNRSRDDQAQATEMDAVGCMADSLCPTARALMSTANPGGRGANAIMLSEPSTKCKGASDTRLHPNSRVYVMYSCLRMCRDG